ncbi:MAG: hypothetical protein WCX83_03055 [Candidatus Cloacimonas sp.]|jgi:hypothetical protein|nr:hypothetical protein [Candidatus Cloacimonadota bacterium]
MAFGASQRRIQKSSGPEDLNLIPIMNFFITIIPMLLVITVTVHMALLSLDLSASGGGGGGSDGSGEGGAGAEEKVKKIELVIYNNKFEVREEGSNTLVLDQVTDGLNNLYDFATLGSVLMEIKSRNENVNEIRVIPYPDVLYDTLIKAIDVSKLQGFVEVKYESVKQGMI